MHFNFFWRISTQIHTGNNMQIKHLHIQQCLWIISTLKIWNFADFYTLHTWHMTDRTVVMSNIVHIFNFFFLGFLCISTWRIRIYTNWFSKKYFYILYFRKLYQLRKSRNIVQQTKENICFPLFLDLFINNDMYLYND